MKAIITQRHSRNRHGQWTDSLENDYVVFFQSQGVDLVPLPNPVMDVRAFMAESGASHIVFSGGGDVNPARYGLLPDENLQVSEIRDALEQRLLELAIKDRIPVLGICRGMQFINVSMGGVLMKDVGLLAGGSQYKPPNGYRIAVKDAGLTSLSGVENFSVRSYHSSAVLVSGLASGLQSFAEAKGLAMVEGFHHVDYPIAGIQWHPERADPVCQLDLLLVRAFRDRTLYWKGANA